MELPKGTNKSIECPVVKTYKKIYKSTSVPRPTPNPSITNVTFDPKIKFKDLDKQYVLLALEYCNGNVRAAASLLGVTNSFVYRRLGRKYY